ncbi:hypothetical protein [Candidatus Avelusimicrobium gallicola]|uniref:Uncharacterized protein n=1 Tax=Candidatus Avelusimicrobium gallicola TaxID=2562704 RepID=A0A1Y4DNR2_9BACT|nr:hypothetical protein [Elusimicrobium sp. An273]OUO57031.1 hypothetical protein B5F75_04075 [Elusimicrobium sp. An273]
MMGIITILIFVVLLAVPGFYIITRKVFPKGSKKSAMWISILLTILLVGILAAVTATTPV